MLHVKIYTKLNAIEWRITYLLYIFYKFIASVLVLEIIAFLHSESVISPSIDAVLSSVEKTSDVEPQSEQAAVSSTNVPTFSASKYAMVYSIQSSPLSTAGKLTISRKKTLNA